VAIGHVVVGERHVAADHLEARMPEDLLEREEIAAVDEISGGRLLALGLPDAHRGPR
jgi:hypothetical protein